MSEPLNIVTEDEARNLWCPFAKHEIHNRCIASGCMAWRWKGTHVRGIGGMVWAEREYGFCGLAPREAPPP